MEALAKYKEVLDDLNEKAQSLNQDNFKPFLYEVEKELMKIQSKDKRIKRSTFYKYIQAHYPKLIFTLCSSNFWLVADLN